MSSFSSSLTIPAIDRTGKLARLTVFHSAKRDGVQGRIARTVKCSSHHLEGGDDMLTTSRRSNEAISGISLTAFDIDQL